MSSSRTSELLELETVLGRHFRDPNLLVQALTHKSYAHESTSAGEFHNESMEFLGDAVLGFIVTDLIYREFPGLTEGRKSKIKAYLVSAAALSNLSVQLGLPRYLRLGRGEEKTGGRNKRALAANALEAVIAALYLDAGIDAVRRLLEPLYAPLIAAIAAGHEVVEDPKTALQEYLQARGLSAARYVVRAETGPQHRKTFHVDLVLGDRLLASAQGPTKKKAAFQAAQTALLRLRQEDQAPGPEARPPD